MLTKEVDAPFKRPLTGLRNLNLSCEDLLAGVVRVVV